MGKPAVHVARMALVTRDSLMGSCKRKGRCGMAECGRGPHSRGMARIAGVAEVAQDVVRIYRLRKIGRVARIAIGEL